MTFSKLEKELKFMKLSAFTILTIQLFLASCNNNYTYTQSKKSEGTVTFSSPEIDMVKSYLQSIKDDDSLKTSTFYADSAMIYDRQLANVLSPKQFSHSIHYIHQKGIKMSYGSTEIPNYYEQIDFTDEVDGTNQWIHAFFNVNFSFPKGNIITIYVNSTIGVKNNKITKVYNMYDPKSLLVALDNQ